MQKKSTTKLLPFFVSLLVLFSQLCEAEPKIADKQEKSLVGSIEDGRYFSRNRSFSFELPIKGEPKALIEAVNDTLSPGAEVIVIKSDSESTDYRFEISHALPGSGGNSNFTPAKTKTFDWYRRLIQRAWKLPLIEIVNSEFKMQEHKAAHAIYKQFSDETSGPRYHIFYLADYNNRVNFLWANISLPEENLETENIIIEATSGPALKAKQSFLSFQLHN